MLKTHRDQREGRQAREIIHPHQKILAADTVFKCNNNTFQFVLVINVSLSVNCLVHFLPPHSYIVAFSLSLSHSLPVFHTCFTLCIPFPRFFRSHFVFCSSSLLAVLVKHSDFARFLRLRLLALLFYASNWTCYSRR